MKLERERDIPAFKGKSWRERWGLRNQAEERDPWILRLKLLLYFLILSPTCMLAVWFADRFFPHQFFLVSFGIVVLLSPIHQLFYSLYITPRIRRALESEVKPSA
jgi:hypothetical protein